MLKVLVVADRVADCSAGQYVKRSGLDVNHWRRSDADFRPNKWALHHVFRQRDRAARFIEKAHMPERIISRTVGVKGINAVVFGGDKENVVLAFARDFYIRKKQWLCIKGAVHLECAKFAELAGVDILSGQD